MLRMDVEFVRGDGVIVSPGTDAAGADARLLVRDAIGEALADAPGFVRVRDVAEACVDEIESRRSFWPSPGKTRNRGPWSTDDSRQKFRVGAGGRDRRDVRGRFAVTDIENTARNAKGLPYAGWVNAGVYNWGASTARLMANLDAVGRTIRNGRQRILERAVEIARER